MHEIRCHIDVSPSWQKMPVDRTLEDGRQREGTINPPIPSQTSLLRHGPRSFVCKPLPLLPSPQPAMPEVVDFTAEKCYSCETTWDTCTPEQRAKWGSFQSALTSRLCRVCHNCAIYYHEKAAQGQGVSIPPCGMLY